MKGDVLLHKNSGTCTYYLQPKNSDTVRPAGKFSKIRRQFCPYICYSVNIFYLIIRERTSDFPQWMTQYDIQPCRIISRLLKSIPRFLELHLNEHTSVKILLGLRREWRRKWTKEMACLLPRIQIQIREWRSELLRNKLYFWSNPDRKE